MQGDIERVLFDEPAIHERLDEMAAQISSDYRDRELTVIAILTGGFIFAADLLRRIPLTLKLECLSAMSYQGKMQTSSEVIFKPGCIAGRRRSRSFNSGRHPGQRPYAGSRSREAASGQTAPYPRLRAVEQKEKARPRCRRRLCWVRNRR